jgi:hypothetical protein
VPINNATNLECRRRLIDALRTNRAIGVTGAGVSAWAGYGTWWDVLHHLAAEVREHSRGAIPNPEVIIRNNPDPLHCARQLATFLGPRFGAFIRNEFGPNGTTPHEVVFRIVNLPFSHFLSFNFETTIERVHDAVGRRYVTLSSPRRDEFLSFLRTVGQSGADRRIVHLHGLFSDPPEWIALTNEGYARIYRDPFFKNALWSILVSTQLVFLGFGFNDRIFRDALSAAAWDVGEQQEAGHFAVVGLWPDENDDALRNTYRDSYKSDPLFYEVRGTREQPDHAGFVEIITGISMELGINRTEGIPVAAAIEASEGQPDPHDLVRAAELGDAIIERADGDGDVQS